METPTTVMNISSGKAWTVIMNRSSLEIITLIPLEQKHAKTNTVMTNLIYHNYAYCPRISNNR